ncbi:MAG: Gamma-glutamylputrescine synthetase PuuA [Alphaproteobacteria bacterium MarineAlpha5_Bin11]|nr:glutamine synthetase [Pelagibacteraceae bacterium]PPR43829.1 MAG: Gamma-glutamylputrescine synthetase PuuA [Alphaproteobacteria bacterium MarineAlpha5_Bin11]PPR51323.1 MAG: Gamma-glutamylputrescine synthetase PuuA [Alphaproteobacteria bacterium MarineAlpha5_Bin10]|tara:strand:+ start:3187 stop:4563 length:1377 start_codon:yes stop_codon:yes gene_type:complete
MTKAIFKNVELATNEELINYLKENPETKYIDAIISDLSGLFRGKRIPVTDAEKLFTDGIQFCYSTFLLDASGYCPDVKGRGFSDGDPDATYYPIANTIKPLPWHKDPIAQVLISIQDDHRYSSLVDPRNILAKVMETFQEINLFPKIAFELEFYLFDKRKSIYERPKVATSPKSKRRSEGTQVYGMKELDDYYDFLEDVNKFCEKQNIPATTASSEFAPGQYEINLRHTDDPLKAADDSAFLRRLIKETAELHGYEASFLSKPFLDQSGSGMHIHISLFDEKGNNVFADESKVLKYSIGGLQEIMYDSFAIFAPNLNAYRRYLPNQFVPVNNTWGPNNRSVALRIPTGDKNSTRIEHRVSGAESNSYLVLSSILSGIHYGITNKLSPNEPRTDNACVNPDENMPKNLNHSLKLLKNSKVLSKYLSKEYIELYVDLKSKELAAVNEEISDVEYKWYLNL